MTEFRKVQQIGHKRSSLAVVIPKEFCIQLGFEKGKYVKVSLDGNRIVIEK